jgi:succinate-semialdehyde dehydrogenase/glutarate-semialdehyde dehydrogenase
VPKGVVGVISPWNYPLSMAVADGLPAIVAGNAVVHKPDGQTPMTALRAIELMHEAGLPADLWQLVNGPGPVVGTAIVQSVDYVCFTGSTRTGRLVARQAGERLIGCSLELGGKNPMLVLRDADVARAAEGAVRACFNSAGQLCVSMERMYVADQVYDAFVAAFVDRVNRMRLSAGTGWDVDMGPLISAAQLETVTRHVEDAKAHGAVVLTGGRARPDLGPLFYEPTVLEGVTPQMECFDNETFGPVVALYRFSDENEAIQRANEGEYGLNASVWTRDTRRGRAIAAQLVAGTVNVNEAYGATFGSIDTPMGGMRASGLGRRQGVEGIRRYQDSQAVATQRLLPLAASHGISDQSYAELMTSALRLLKKLGRA